MDLLIHFSWRLYLALPMMGLGLVIAIGGAKRARPALVAAVRGDPSHLVTLMRGFRATVIGLALVGIGAAWIWHLTWLFIVSLATACGESLETFLVIYALQHGADVSLGARRVRVETRRRLAPSS